MLPIPRPAPWTETLTASGQHSSASVPCHPYNTCTLGLFCNSTGILSLGVCAKGGARRGHITWQRVRVRGHLPALGRERRARGKRTGEGREGKSGTGTEDRRQADPPAGPAVATMTTGLKTAVARAPALLAVDAPLSPPAPPRAPSSPLLPPAAAAGLARSSVSGSTSCCTHRSE